MVKYTLKRTWGSRGIYFWLSILAVSGPPCWFLVKAFNLPKLQPQYLYTGENNTNFYVIGKVKWDTMSSAQHSGGHVLGNDDHSYQT